jgi:tetratricopeptide (TPR) repeat protein
VFFVVALLTKTVTATLPAALLVIFWWQRRKLSWRRDVAPLLPWFALGAGCGLFTAHFERKLIGAEGADFSLSVIERGMLAGRVFWFYLGKLAWPADLIFIYPRWRPDPASTGQWLYPAAALALLAAVVFAAMRRPWGRAVLAVLLLFAGTLFPVLGFFNVYPFLYSYVADHFQYLAMLPVLALAGAAGATVCAALPRWNRLFLAGAVVVSLGALSHTQAGIYRNVFTLYDATLARNPSCWMAHNNLAIALAAAGRVPEAIPHLEATLALKPDFAQAENNLGDDLMRLDRGPEAIPHFERALRLQPDYAKAHHNLGIALAMMDRTDQAIPHFARAVEIDPAFTEAELDWAVALTQTGQFSTAVAHFERAIAVAPGSADAQLAYGSALTEHNDLEGAVAHCRAALELAPDSAEIHRALALALRRLGRIDEAQEHELAAHRPAGRP